MVSLRAFILSALLEPLISSTTVGVVAFAMG
jgi:hypothetical protein